MTGARKGRRPPVEHQFKPGVSGNYRGRPRKKKDAVKPNAPSALGTADSAILAEAARSISVPTENGLLKMTMDELIARALATKAAKGDVRAAQLFQRERRLAQQHARTEVIQTFEAALETKIALTIAVIIAEYEVKPLPKMHPDQIVLMEDKRVLMLPTLAMAVERRRVLTQISALEQEATKLQRQLRTATKNQEGLVTRIKLKLNKLRGLQKLGFVPDFPGIEERVRKEAEAQATKTHGIKFGDDTEYTAEQLEEELKRRGLPTKIFDE